MLIAELAVWASVMPFHADWLNERSSTPPTSSTMQALKAAPVAAPPPVAVPVLEPVPLDLDPQAAMVSTQAATATVTRTERFTVPPRRARGVGPGLSVPWARSRHWACHGSALGRH